MSNILDRISAIGIVPIVSGLTSREDCLALARALSEGGLPAMEITFRTEGTEDYIRCVREACPQVLVGAGTVLTTRQAQQAIDAGAQYLLTPGLNPEVVRFARERGVDILPGIATPSELEQAVALGVDTVKVFPAQALGGAAAIRALCGPYKNVRFLPTGGVDLSNLAGYFAIDRVAACGGSYMIGSHLARREWGEITALCRRSVQTMLGLRLAHVGVNAPDAPSAASAAGAMAGLLGMSVAKDSENSVFVEECVEFMKGAGLGTHGHIGFATPCLERAVRYFEAMGASFRTESARRDENGKLSAIYFAGEIGGFAVHLMRG